MNGISRVRLFALSAQTLCVLAALMLSLVIDILPACAQIGDVGEVATVTTKREVDIGLMYNGDYIYFFGSVPDPSADVIVKLTSVDNIPLTVDRKGKVAFLWMNVKQFKIDGLPLLYKIHSTKPLNQILSPELARELGIGYEVLRDQMQLKVVRGEAAADDRSLAFDGILKLKQESNLYNIDEKRIEITGGKLFKHYFRFPPAAKEGTYRAESYIFMQGKLVARGMDEVVIKKSGIEATVTNLAHDRPVIFGFICVTVALAMGLLVGFIFKKGGGH
jgi:uncharacterized protein (TIGR02186 family)